ncbi:MAG: hypothetical protein HY396_01295 [Candidatus Doudnabacteria bacterium]|nr:hypothetical protein [Candidatus Doudnabacteria bacterium]
MIDQIPSFVNRKESGFIALMSAIIVSVLLIAITFTLSFTGFYSRFNVLDSEYKERSIGLAEACADTALLKKATDPAYTVPETINVGTDTCDIISVADNGTQVTIKTRAVFQKSFTNIEVVANSDDLSIISWDECPTLELCP